VKILAARRLLTTSPRAAYSRIHQADVARRIASGRPAREGPRSVWTRGANSSSSSRPRVGSASALNTNHVTHNRKTIWLPVTQVRRAGLAERGSRGGARLVPGRISRRARRRIASIFILTRRRGHGGEHRVVFAEKEPIGDVSDHIGLRARLSLTT